MTISPPLPPLHRWGVLNIAAGYYKTSGTLRDDQILTAAGILEGALTQRWVGPHTEVGGASHRGGWSLTQRWVKPHIEVGGAPHRGGWGLHTGGWGLTYSWVGPHTLVQTNMLHFSNSEIYLAYRNLYYADYSNTSSPMVMRVKQFFETQVCFRWK